MKKPPRQTAELSQSVNHRLNMYALATGAAGVGVLALSQPAEAKIIYTPADKHIRINGGLVKLDLNHDGITDVFLGAAYRGGSGCKGTLWLQARTALGGSGGNENTITVFYLGSALPKGKTVGPGDSFLTRAKESLLYGVCGAQTSFSGGAWKPGKPAYVGLKFAIKGRVHYGWARLEVLVSTKRYHYPAVITGYAYETIPGKPIIAGATKGSEDDAQPAPASIETHTPAPATLGTLALGARGLSIWRREEPAVGREQSN